MALFRKIIKITARDSPNVRLAEAQLRSGQRVTGEELVPGVLSYQEYLKRRKLWDKQRQTIGLDAEFYEGREILLYPPDWRAAAERRWYQIRGMVRRASGIGIDPAEGGDRTSMCAVDELGIIELVSRKTPRTTDVVKEALAFIRKHDVPPERVCIDRGGGGKQHADRMAEVIDPRWPNGCVIRTVAFGESLALDPRRGLVPIEEKKEVKAEKYVYVNRRAQMFHELSLLLDPDAEIGFALPPPDLGDQYARLHQQMAPIPKVLDGEGRYRMLPKNKRDPDSKEKCLIDLIGHSPDELDSVVLAEHARLHRVRKVRAGAV